MKVKLTLPRHCLRQPNGVCIKSKTGSQTVMSDEECSSSSSDSDSEGDDLIDLDQLKQQIEKEERSSKSYKQERMAKHQVVTKR